MPKRVRRVIVSVLFSVFGLSIAYIYAQHLPRGTATYISHDDLMAVKQRSADKPVNDTQVAVVDVSNEYHVAVGIAHRSKASVNTPGGGGVEHSDITEVYYIISGNGILNTGGTIKDLKDPQPGAPTGGPSGPTSSGGEIIGGVSKAVGPGDVVVVPPNTPHRWTDIKTDEVVYVLMRPDPHKVLPVMNLLTQ